MKELVTARRLGKQTKRTEEGLVAHAPGVEVAAVLVADTVVALVAVTTVGALAASLT